MSLLHRLTGSASVNLCNNALSFSYAFDIITGIIHLNKPHKMNMIVHKLPFSLLKEYIVGINNTNNNKAKDKYNCYDDDYKLNTIRKQRSFKHCFDKANPIKICDKSHSTTL